MRKEDLNPISIMMYSLIAVTILIFILMIYYEYRPGEITYEVTSTLIAKEYRTCGFACPNVWQLSFEDGRVITDDHTYVDDWKIGDEITCRKREHQGLRCEVIQ